MSIKQKILYKIVDFLFWLFRENSLLYAYRIIDECWDDFVFDYSDLIKETVRGWYE